MPKQSMVVLLTLTCLPQCCSSSPKPDMVTRALVLPGESPLSPIRECGIEGFTLAIDEYLVDEIKTPFVVRKIVGKITNDQGGWPKGLPILLEVRKGGKDMEVRKVYADKNGNFYMKTIPEGRYCFKATVMGWQSQMGIIIIDMRADPDKKVFIKMRLGV